MLALPGRLCRGLIFLVFLCSFTVDLLMPLQTFVLSCSPLNSLAGPLDSFPDLADAAGTTESGTLTDCTIAFIAGACIVCACTMGACIAGSAGTCAARVLALSL
ncbi:hypothetical protein E6O75_ATG08842 [Venturia nashicola]|uniref:Uncharacterized protein n=1 Tax=Venturia nashicola TaxID=86259 RepID=A0A4Z1NUN6_9PEZI|nr:hypothetical protein E6O75_ATG08842 [Venturia nashicola]